MEQVITKKENRPRGGRARRVEELRPRFRGWLSTDEEEIERRRKKSEVEGQLPGRTDKHFFVPMHEEQGARYEDYELRVSRLAAAARRRPLTPDEFKKLQQ